MAQGQEGNIKRKGQNHRNLVECTSGALSICRKQTKTQFCHWWQGRRILFHRVLSNQEKENLASARPRIWHHKNTVWEGWCVREQRRGFLHLVPCDQVGTSLPRTLSLSNLMARAGDSAVLYLFILSPNILHTQLVICRPPFESQAQAPGCDVDRTQAHGIDTVLWIKYGINWECG